MKEELSKDKAVNPLGVLIAVASNVRWIGLSMSSVDSDGDCFLLYRFSDRDPHNWRRKDIDFNYPKDCE